MPMITTLHTELYDALVGHDWSAAFADGVVVSKGWDPELRHEQLDAAKAHIDIVPGDLSTKRIDAVSFLPSAVCSVAIRGRATTDARKVALCDFAEAVLDFLSEQPANAFSWVLIEVQTAPLVHLELLKTRNVWFTHLLVKFGYEVGE